MKHIPILDQIKTSWHKAFAKLWEFGGISTGNSVEIFHDGDDAFRVIYEEISEASESIFVETYIFAGDELGLGIRDALIQAANRGVVVVLLYDYYGSSGLSNSFINPMIRAGIKVLGFNPIWPWRRRGPLLFRDHRKIIVIDKKTAFCGGINISSDYAGPIFGNNKFRDSLARIKGPAVLDLLAITEESIFESEFDEKRIAELMTPKASGNPHVPEWLRGVFDTGDKAVANNKNGTPVQVLRSNTRRNLTHIQKSMELSINRAVSYCYFTTPYFLPYDDLRVAMLRAKQRGVDVRILTAGLSDVPLMRYASRHVYQNFLDAGIRIYEMQNKVLHAKLATIDGIHSSIGSYNLDHWSARRNLEVNVSIIDQNIAMKLQKQFEIDLGLSIEVNTDEVGARSIFEKIVGWLAYQLFRI